MLNFSKCVLLVCFVVAVTGCTAPSQPLARKALMLAREQQRTIIADLSNISKQRIVDRAVFQVRKFVEEGNSVEAQIAVEKMASDFDKISWLQSQHERAESLLRLAQFYIDSRQGILNILSKEYEEYKKTLGETNDNSN